jgi:tRNA U34 5-methylaminomethyl-2-thiouridine-forming methyltransferase MnmC
MAIPEENPLSMDDSSKNFRIRSHANGTATLVDEENGQAMHSRIGPSLEARLVYADRARIEDVLVDAGSAHVLYDVGMGTGANVAATLERVRDRSGARGRLDVYSFESKPDGLRAALGHLDAFPILIDWVPRLRELLESSETEFRLGEVDVRWRLVAGDFRVRIVEAPVPDTIYYDFYSPKIVPELWSLECFTRLREKIGAGDAALYTYSAATPVRLHLLAAGFFVGSGASTGAKSETTVAATRIERLVDPLTPTWLGKLDASASIAAPAFADAKRRALANPQWARVSG